MKFVLDTNAYSSFFAGENQVKVLLEQADQIIVPSIVLGELFSGFNQGTRFEKNLRELDRFLEQPGVSVKDIEREEAEKYGILVKNLKITGTPIPTNDIWIAATVLTSGYSLLSRDSHFDVITGLQRISF